MLEQGSEKGDADEAVMEDEEQEGTGEAHPFLADQPKSDDPVRIPPASPSRSSQWMPASSAGIAVGCLVWCICDGKSSHMQPAATCASGLGMCG